MGGGPGPPNQDLTRAGQSAEQAPGDFAIFCIAANVSGIERPAIDAASPAGTEPPGWQWVWTLTPTSQDETDVSLTYDWSQVTDKELLKKVSFPLIPAQTLEASLGNLAAAVAS